MGVLSGIITGLTAAWLYRRFHDIRLPDYLAFFGGKRFVPIITAFAALILGIIFGLIWGPIQAGINDLGQWIVGLGAVGAGLYGFLNRLLIPLGVHHVINSYVWTLLGSYTGPKGIVYGDLNRYFKAFDETTGNVLWQIRTNNAVNSFPISYSVNGKQYIAVATGTGSGLVRSLGWGMSKTRSQ